MFCTLVSNIGKYSLWNECYEPRENITKTNECDLIYVLLSATSECLNIYYYIINFLWWQSFNLYSNMWYVAPDHSGLEGEILQKSSCWKKAFIYIFKKLEVIPHVK